MAETKYSSKRNSTIIMKTNNSFIQYIGTEIRQQILHMFVNRNTINSGTVISYKEIKKRKKFILLKRLLVHLFKVGY